MDEEKYPQNPTGAWIITRMFSASGVSIDVKASGTTVEAAIDDLCIGIKHGMEKYGWQAELPKAPLAPLPKPDVAVKIAAEEGNQELAAELAEDILGVPEPPKGKTWELFDAVFVRYLPQPDEKCTLEFFGNDKKIPYNDYPTVKVNKWPWEGVSGLMKHVTSHDPSQAGEFSLPCRVYWTEGKEYTTPAGYKGHYKNVAHVRPI
jgi:hypothetical protein